MAKLIALDDGHGMTTPGKRTPPIPELNNRVIKENEFNRAVVALLDEELKRCGFNTLMVAPSDAETSLGARTNLANAKGADAYISIHYNAFDGKFDAYDPEGISVHIYPGSTSGRKLGEAILKYLIQGTSQKNRGIVESNFHVLRETKMVAILSENGFMDNKREAMLMLDAAFQKEVAVEHAKGICDYFGVKYVAASSGQITEGTLIMGKSECTAEQLEAFLMAKNPKPNLNISVTEFCKLWLSEGEIEGVRGDIGFCQACHETGYFKYGGIVLPDQNNYSGIGALNGNTSGNAATFPDPKTGIQASIQHLKAYGSLDPLVNPLVDPRFKLVTRGIAPHFEDLGGRWAWPGYDKKKYSSLEAAKAAGNTYGHYIMKKYDDMIKIKVQDPDPLPDPKPDPIPVKELDPRIKEVEQLLQKAIAILQSIN
ncbi:MAG: N-acetylmuramoyl-L-alanine amidase [Clostridia bacterium]|nr:N-acetylmuramoyl-L-alanine amidase [Clostridia bacterium]